MSIITEIFHTILNLGHHVTVLHYSSIEDPLNTDFNQQYPSIRFVDFRDYNYSIDIAISSEKPDIALFLSSDPLIMRALFLSLKRQCIPCVVLYPGLWSTQDTSAKKSPLLKLFNLLAKVSTRISQYLFAVRHYFKQVSLSSSKLKLFLNLFHVEIHKSFSKLPIPSLDYQVDLVLVYNQLDKIHAKAKFPSAQHIICGYPELYRLSIKPSQSLPSYFNSSENSNNQVLYIGSGPNSRNGYLTDPVAYFSYLTRISNYFATKGVRLIIRPHYSLYNQIESLNDGILMLDNSSNIDLLLSSIDYCLTEPSTLSICVLFKSIPLLGVRLFELSALSYGPVFHENVLFTELYDLDSIPQLLSKFSNFSSSQLLRNHAHSFADVKPSKVIYESIMGFLP